MVDLTGRRFLMKTRADKLLPLAVLSILVISAAPAAFASTLTVTLNPTTKVAEVHAVSTTKIVLTYPANSTMSNNLKDVNSSLALSGSFDSSYTGVREFQGDFHDEDGGVSVHNMTASVDYTAKGNATAFVLNKETNITAWVTGIFHVVNGTVQADLGWRSFVVVGALNLNLGDHMVDINQVGSAMADSLSTHTAAIQILADSFGRDGIWTRPTLNYSALNAPLSTWTKNYDSATNTTTFSKTISGSYTLSASADYNGQKYTMSATSDPSASIAIEGYATASGNSLVVGSAPATLSSSLWVAAAIGVVVVGAVAYLALRSRAKPKVSNTITLQ
jgi:uncharacterized protein (DUF2141 family)